MKKSLKILSVLLCLIFVLSTAIVPASAAITDAETPITANEAKLKWSLKLGTGYVNAPSVPAVYGDIVFTMCKTTLYKLDAETGEILQTAELSSTPSFGYTPVLAANGMVFCPLEGGMIEAFAIESMERVWTYTDPLGGQALSPVAYNNGLLYAGFWIDEEVDASFVCLDAASGALKWSNVQKGGFYWAEPALIGDFIVIVGDNGSAKADAPVTLKCFNKTTGKLIDTAEISGDQRSGISVYNGKLYFVTKAGYIYKAQLNSDGNFVLLEKSKLSGASTSTPVILNEKIYIGVQSNGFSGKIEVLDSETLEIINTVPMNGYPQSEILLTTAYDDVYIYSTYNAAPGGITAINGSTLKTEQLFIPDKGQTGYCISPVAATNNGTLIYKNDSGTVFAVGKTAPTEKEKSFFEKIIDWFTSVFNLILSLFR